MTQSPYYEAPNDYGVTPSKNTNKTLIIIIVILALLIVCCCCTTLIVLWFTGDSIVETLGVLNFLTTILY